MFVQVPSVGSKGAGPCAAIHATRCIDINCSARCGFISMYPTTDSCTCHFMYVTFSGATQYFHVASCVGLARIVYTCQKHRICVYVWFWATLLMQHARMHAHTHTYIHTHTRAHTYTYTHVTKSSRTLSACIISSTLWVCTIIPCTSLRTVRAQGT